MTIYISADHRGFNLKARLFAELKNAAYDVADMGAEALVPDDDFPEYAARVARKVSADPAQSRGIVLCGSGFGVEVTANKFEGVRAGLAMSPDHVYAGRHDDDLNVLALATDFIDEATALKMVKVFLSTPFAADEKYARRLRQIGEIEAKRA